MEAKVAQGIKESEVGYQVAFSKQELRKVTKEYHGREVKKGLDHLYKKVEKHLCEEENLLQVIIINCYHFCTIYVIMCDSLYLIIYF